MKVRRLRKHVAELEVTAFINLIVVLVPFLLSTAVFTRLSVLELTLPAQSSGVAELKVDDLQLEIVMRGDAIEVGDKLGGLIQRLPHTTTGNDLAGLAGLMQQIKQRFPQKTSATVLAEPDTSYDALVQLMDAVRSGPATGATHGERVDLFPDISIGDAPVAQRQAGK